MYGREMRAVTLRTEHMRLHLFDIKVLRSILGDMLFTE
jgi:hypothetical protein